MVTPTKDQIEERAKELFFRENPSAPTPEEEELKESSFWESARDDLMRGVDSEALSYVEQMAGELGRRVVTEEEHDRLIDLELRLEKLRAKEKKIAVSQEDLEARRKELSEIQTKASTLGETVVHREVKEAPLHKAERKRPLKPQDCRALAIRKCLKKELHRQTCLRMAKRVCPRLRVRAR